MIHLTWRPTGVAPELAEEPESFALDPATGCWVACESRLRYLGRLLDDLRRSAPANDASLFLSAYLTWGSEALAGRVEGDFACVVWDPRVSRLLCVRDTFGVYELFVRFDRNGVAVASRLSSLLESAPVIPRLNSRWVAGFLKGDFRAWRKSTAWENIQRVEPGSVFEVSARGRRTALRRRLCPEPLTAVEPGRWFEAFRDTFIEACRECGPVSGRVGVWLSGGLDSTAVACVLSDAERPAPPTFSAIFESTPSADERAYLDALSAFRPAIPMRRVLCDDAWAFQGLGDDDEPDVDVLRVLTSRLADRAAREGCDTVLSGLWADQVLLSDVYLRPSILADLPVAVARRELRWFRDARREAVPHLVARAIRHMRRPGHNVSHAIDSSLNSGLMSARLSSVWRTCARSGLRPAFPYLSRRLVELVMVTPPECLFGLGEIKLLPKQALAGLVPPEATARRLSHGHFSDLEARGLANEGARLRAWMEESVVVRMGFMSRSTLRRIWTTTQRAERVPGAFKQWALLESWLRHPRQVNLKVSCRQ